MRPGCGRPAVSRLSYDTIACQVWLDPVPDWPGRAQEICELHTTRLTVPRGWVLCDRRSELRPSVEPEQVASEPVPEPEPVALASADPSPATRPPQPKLPHRRPAPRGAPLPPLLPLPPLPLASAAPRKAKLARRLLMTVTHRNVQEVFGRWPATVYSGFTGRH